MEEALKLLGINEKETDVYMALLALGESHIVPIAKNVRLPRTTVQYILEQLDSLGIIQIIEKRGRRIYLPLPPRIILTKLREKNSYIEEQIDLFKNSLPELNQIYSASPFHPRVRFFSGDEIRVIYEEILDSPIEETLFIGEMDKVAKAVGHSYLQKWMKRRAEKHIGTKAVRVAGGEVVDDIFNSKAGYLRSVKLAPQGFESPSHIIIYCSNVAIITTEKESLGVVITSREYAKTMTSCFREVWKNSKKLI